MSVTCSQSFEKTSHQDIILRPNFVVHLWFSLPVAYSITAHRINRCVSASPHLVNVQQLLLPKRGLPFVFLQHGTSRILFAFCICNLRLFFVFNPHVWISSSLPINLEREFSLLSSFIRAHRDTSSSNEWSEQSTFLSFFGFFYYLFFIIHFCFCWCACKRRWWTNSGTSMGIGVGLCAKGLFSDSNWWFVYRLHSRKKLFKQKYRSLP